MIKNTTLDWSPVLTRKDKDTCPYRTDKDRYWRLLDSPFSQKCMVSDLCARTLRAAKGATMSAAASVSKSPIGFKEPAIQRTCTTVHEHPYNDVLYVNVYVEFDCKMNARSRVHPYYVAIHKFDGDIRLCFFPTDSGGKSLSIEAF